MRRRIDSLASGGGYILGTAHSLLDDVPVENVLALFDEAGRHRPGAGPG